MDNKSQVLNDVVSSFLIDKNDCMRNVNFLINKVDFDSVNRIKIEIKKIVNIDECIKESKNLLDQLKD